jgi:23S rRNA (guanosine2251-2'-O)-methyltransferase
LSRESLQRVAGLHSVRAALHHGADQVVRVWFDARRRDRRLRQLLEELSARGIHATGVERGELDRLVPGANHQGIVAETRVPAARDESDLDLLLAGAKAPLLLVLDGVQDPHNLGACLRTADAAGVLAVVAPKDRSVGLTPVACKVASGAAESVPFVQVTNLARVLRRLREQHGVWVVGTAGEAGQDLYATDLTGPLALVMGGEEKGLRRLTREQCDSLVRLPMAGQVASLNVSVATGVALYESVRQRRGSVKD